MAYRFYNGPWENSEKPSIVMDDPGGGDPHIIAELASIYRPDDLHDLCRKASAPRRCWLCDEPSVGLHSHFGDYVPMCAAHMAERATA
jgi:hypothetical protein